MKTIIIPLHVLAYAFASGDSALIGSSFTRMPNMAPISGTFALHSSRSPGVSTVSDQDSTMLAIPIFDFSANTTETISKFDRIDDAIMGGISTSVLREVSGNDYATWAGVCRIDGGGFCGFRTLPFVTPINVSAADGIFVDCRLVSDDEPERRVWKMTVRTESGYRGEQVYQAEFDMPKKPMDENGWNRIYVPFEKFQLVRGPRLVMDGPSLDVTNGLFQIGFTMSKFKIGYNTTEIDNFRPGYFDLQIEKIGSFANNYVASGDLLSVVNVETESKEIVKKKRPIMLKVLGPLFKFFFSEKSKRRKRAMKLLTEERGMSRMKAINFGAKLRSSNSLLSIVQTLGIISNDIFRAVIFNTLKFVLFYPLSALRKALILIKSTMTGKPPVKIQSE